jgi:outer membrane protein OmpA-like peptidoglycan-associated protein
MIKSKNLFFMLYSLFILLCACAQYTSPPRDQWPNYLRGASLSDMTPTLQQAKTPLIQPAIKNPASGNYLPYMSQMEFELFDNLRKPGISVQRAGTDVVVILVRDAIMELNAANISNDGADTLKTISKILKKYDGTFIEVAGYTDAMKDKTAAEKLSADMAQRVAVYFAQDKINMRRMFVVGRGAARPIAAQDIDGRLTNRRVELKLSPIR